MSVVVVLCFGGVLGAEIPESFNAPASRTALNAVSCSSFDAGIPGGGDDPPKGDEDVNVFCCCSTFGIRTVGRTAPLTFGVAEASSLLPVKGEDDDEMPFGVFDFAPPPGL